VKVAHSTEHSLKGYADNVTLISCDIDVNKSVLQIIDLKAANLDLTLNHLNKFLFCLMAQSCSERFATI